MTVTNLIPDVISYLVAQCQANPALGAANPQVSVFDGPVSLVGEQMTTPQRLWIGYDALNGVPEAASATQSFAFLGTSGGYRDETGDITCTAEAWDGSAAMATVRAQCKAVMGAVEIMLRGAPTTGPGDSSMGNLVQWSQTEGPFLWTQSLDDNGASAMCVFHITYFVRLTP